MHASGACHRGSPPPLAGSRQRREIPFYIMVYTVYILRSNKNRYYVGCTGNLVERIKEHKLGKTKSTKFFESFEVIYTEIFQTKQEAYKRERQIKKYKGGEAFKKLLSHCRVI